MRCCVPLCKNDSRHMSKSQGITFHVFPTEPTLRASWLKAVGKDTWSPRERSAVCSEHFLSDDLYETKSGLRKVRPGAVPIVLQDNSNGDFNASDSSKICRICLAIDVKLYPMKLYDLEKAYEDLTGVTLSNENDLPRKLCSECAKRLLNCDKLKSKSLRANLLLLELLKKQKNLTIQNISTVNRHTNRLSSDLITKTYGPDHCDTYIEYNENEQTEENPIQEVTLDVKSEREEDIYVNEIYAESEAREEVGENEAESQVNYSTDDSLPLETQRKKVKKIKKERKARKKIDKSEPKIDRRRKPFLNDDLNETLFTITDLTFEEQLAEIHKRQDSANYKNSMFKCTACFKGFLDETAYNGHMTRHTDQCGEYECDICKTHFKHPHALRKHITAHHTQRFSCNHCPYVTTHRQTARLHERWHKGTKYQCPHCQDEFVKFTTYMGHVRIKHPSDFVCALCGYAFVSQKGIELHQKLKHRLHDGRIPDDGPLCDLCNVRFVSQEAYRRHLHVSARHNNSDSDSKESNKTRRGRSRVIREKKRSVENMEDDENKKMYPSQLRKAEGPIPCEQCGLQLEDSRAYHGHFRRMHPDKNRTNYPSMKSPCMCEVCGRMFQSHALLKDHRWVHTGERPFACEACGKSFRMRQRLVAHRRVHAPRRALYACALCGKSFSTHSNRQRHMFIHTGLKPFKCEMCGKCFKHASEKRAHITYVHLKKPWPKRARGKRRTDRQGQLMGPGSTPAAGDMELAPPMWPACDPKMDMNSIIDDKPIYYNLKI